MKSSLSLWALLLCLICLCEGFSVQRNKTCYDAKTCIHNAHEKCGVDGQGNLRWFYDSCDILEFNCLKGTDYTKTLAQKCDHLPPIDAVGVDQNPRNNVTQNKMNKDVEVPNQEKNDNTNGSPNLEELAVKGEITIDDDEIKGEISLNDEVEEALSNQEYIAVGGESEAPNQEEYGNTDKTPKIEESAIKAEITMDSDEVQGDITLNDEAEETLLNQETAAVEEELEAPEDEHDYMDGTPNLEESVIKGEITMDGDEIKGEITFNDETEKALLNQKEPSQEEI